MLRMSAARVGSVYTIAAILELLKESFAGGIVAAQSEVLHLAEEADALFAGFSVLHRREGSGLAGFVEVREWLDALRTTIFIEPFQAGEEVLPLLLLETGLEHLVYVAVHLYVARPRSLRAGNDAFRQLVDCAVLML